jgi:hypothetical protein
MKLDRFIRLAVGLLILLVFVIAIAAMLFVTESALNVCSCKGPVSCCTDILPQWPGWWRPRSGSSCVSS